MAGRNNLNLLDLPIDILSLILGPLVTSPTPIQLCPCSTSPINPLPVLLAHPALQAIAVPLLYTANRFVLDATGSHAQHVRRHLAADGAAAASASSLLATRDARRRVANLQVRFDRLRGWVHAGLVPMLTDMVVQGALEHLTVWVRSPPEGQRREQVRRRSRMPGGGGGGGAAEDNDLAMFARPPLEGLLHVLADPYLRTARLWVDRLGHVRAWCRFHAGARGLECGSGAGSGTEAGGGPSGERDGQLGLRLGSGEAEGTGTGPGMGPGVGMVEIDWRLVLQVVDPERKDVTVAGDGRRWW
ncbi:hypothetical protein QQX98_012714 [Neonectria punicea]|uniref:F-box domain-containing protein n=1 Tax=Neonectria punicea TaxID=979145 RepID=A0ABR1GIE0_9HYPO